MNQLGLGRNSLNFNSFGLQSATSLISVLLVLTLGRSVVNKNSSFFKRFSCALARSSLVNAYCSIAELSVSCASSYGAASFVPARPLVVGACPGIANLSVSNALF